VLQRPPGIYKHEYIDDLFKCVLWLIDGGVVGAGNTKWVCCWPVRQLASRGVTCVVRGCRRHRRRHNEHRPPMAATPPLPLWKPADDENEDDDTLMQPAPHQVRRQGITSALNRIGLALTQGRPWRARSCCCWWPDGCSNTRCCVRARRRRT
jgi:hypothetical protein